MNENTALIEISKAEFQSHLESNLIQMALEKAKEKGVKVPENSTAKIDFDVTKNGYVVMFSKVGSNQ